MWRFGMYEKRYIFFQPLGIYFGKLFRFALKKGTILTNRITNFLETKQFQSIVPLFLGKETISINSFPLSEL